MALLKTIESGVREKIYIYGIDSNDILDFNKYKLTRFKSIVESIKSPNKQLEVYARNKLFYHHFKEEVALVKNNFGAPECLPKEVNISFSHSYPYVVLYTHPHDVCGIDVELIREKVLKIAHKFCKPNELNLIQSSVEATLIWSAKETAFKIFQKGGLDFKQHIHINFIDNDKIYGHFNKEKSTDFAFNYTTLQNHVLVYGVFE